MVPLQDGSPEYEVHMSNNKHTYKEKRNSDASLLRIRIR